MAIAANCKLQTASEPLHLQMHLHLHLYLCLHLRVSAWMALSHGRQLTCVWVQVMDECSLKRRIGSVRVGTEQSGSPI